VIACEFSSDGLRAASASEDCTVKLWNTKKGSLDYGSPYNKVSTFVFHEKAVNCLSFHPEGRHTLVTGGEDNDIVLWDALKAQIKTVLTGHTEAIRSVCWTSGGHQMISGSTDSTVRMWDPKNFTVDVSFACLSRLCALASCTTNFTHYIACGDGSGVLYILNPVGLKESSGKK